MKDPRRTRAWRQLSKQVCREEPRCWLRYPGCTYWSTEGDHMAPVEERPDLALVRSNVRGACRHCNRKRGMGAAPTRTEAAPALGIFD